MKPTITIRPTCIKVEPYHIGDCIRLESCFKIYDMVTHDYKYIGIKWNPDTQTLYLPRGIDLWYLQSCFGVENNELRYEDADPYDEIAPCSLKCLPRDKEQEEAIRFTMGTGEYYRNRQFSQLSLNLNTGKGKTYVSVFTIVASKRKSMIVATIRDWLIQWKDAIMEYTTMKANKICVISGANMINMLLMGRSRYCDADVFLITHSSIKSYGDTYGWDKVHQLFQLLKIGNLFIDEAHKNFDNICNLNNSINVAKTYFITATPARSDETENKIYQYSIKNIPGIDLFDEDKDPHTAYLAIKYNSKPSAEDISECRNMYGLDRNKYTNYVVHKKEFYDVLRVVMDLVHKADRGNDRFLFYIGTNAGILVVKDWLEDNYPEMRGNIGVYTSISPNKEKEKYKKYLLSTTKSAGEAADFRGLRMSVVLAEPFKSEVLTRQTLGRTRGKNTMYIELVDLGFKKINQWANDKLAVLNKYATSVKRINLSSLLLNERLIKISKDDARLRKHWEEKLKVMQSPFAINEDEKVSPFLPLPYYAPLKNGELE